ncbi:nicotinate-nucleotide adenylyltransferase [Euzebya tangerina]|uniref:nicotinate-nucleotide adenylyltransferase n=1 Tax=Euzebya tangerina TaxID=591198 RepID=UPI000E30D003|nr:nicotinate-nucleotide adenylyltransferase [Euzebya tangerina]
MARRLGIMGGTFDPIHMGHLVAAETARVDVGLDEVVFVPAGDPWQKTDRDVSPAEQRYLMTVLATAANPAFSVSRLEVDRDGPTYTVDTLRAVRDERPGTTLFFITGADAILNILTWKDAEEALQLATFVAATRPGHDLSSLERQGLREHVTVLDIPALAISSSDIRARFAADAAVRYLIPDSVEQFARKHALYAAAAARPGEHLQEVAVGG